MTTLFAFLFVLGVLIFVHEFGHFLVARLHGVRVLRFSLGFDPKIVKFERGGTEYSIGLIPLGGFVKLAGETVEEARTGAPDEFLSKSKWVRFQVYLAGPIMNLLLAWILLAIVLFRGANVALYTSAPAVVGEVAPASPAERAGLKSGDRITSVNGAEIPTWDALDIALATKANRELALGVDRGGQSLTLRVTPQGVTEYDIGQIGILPVVRPQILVVNPGSPAQAAGFQIGDVVLGVGGDTRLDNAGVIDRLQKSPGAPLVFNVERAGKPMDVTVTPDKSGIIGVTLSPYETRRVEPTILQAFKLSAQQNWETTVQIGHTVRDLVTRQAKVNQLMGPVAIAKMSGQAASLGWIQLLGFMAMISLNLGLLNLMPVPVLDGGHIAILAAEGVSRRDFSVKVKERILIAGAALIVTLMVTVIYNDVMRLLR